MSACTNCNGSGRVPRAFAVPLDEYFSTTEKCLDCNGTGKELLSETVARAVEQLEPEDVDAIQFCINCVGAQPTDRHSHRVAQAQAQLATLIDANRELLREREELIERVAKLESSPVAEIH